MYEAFFKLNDLPFRSTPDLDFFYSDASRGEIVDAIIYSLDRGDGVLKVVGEVGSGKTTILRKLAHCLPSNYNIIYINSPNLSPSDILFFICHEFNLEVSTGDHRFHFVNKLHQFFISEHARGRQCIILVDEAQAMPLLTLEEIRLLSNLETDQHKLVQIILFGQPELDHNLAKPEIRQFLSRVTQSIYLPALLPADVFSYLNFRMRKAGYTGNDVFGFSVAKLICKKSKGMIREIHSIADSALLAAYCDDSKVVKPHHLSSSRQKSFYLKYQTYFLFILASLIAGLLWLFLKYPLPSYKVDNADSSVQESASENIVIDPVVVRQIANDVDADTVIVDADTVIVDADTVIVELKPTISNSVKTADDVFERFDSLSTNLVIGPTEGAYHQYMRDLVDLLSSLEEHRYSIQIITGGVSDLERVVNDLANHLDRQYLYWVVDHPRYILFYGVYTNFADAQNDIQRLPNSYRIGSPIVVRSSSVRNRLINSLNSIRIDDAQ